MVLGAQSLENPKPGYYLNAPQQILIRSVNWLGDAIMSLPAIQRLREKYPKASLTLLTHEKLAGLWETTTYFDSVLTFAKGESPWTVGRRLREGNFDTALILPNSLRTALECWHARIPQRVGYSGNLRSPLLTHAIAPRTETIPMRKRMPIDIEYRLTNQLEPEIYPATAHHVHQYLHLAAELGADATPLTPRLNRTTEASKFADPGQPHPYIGLIPGAEYGPAKRWPAEHFVEAGKQIIEQHAAHLLLLGGPRDTETAEEIAEVLPPDHITNLTGQTSLGELIDALATCDAILANDSGPMHLAAALGTPVVVPFGSTSPDLTGPGLPESDDSPHHLLRTNAPCSPCFLRECPIDSRCLKNISVERAVDAVKSILQNQAS